MATQSHQQTLRNHAEIRETSLCTALPPSGHSRSRPEVVRTAKEPRRQQLERNFLHNSSRNAAGSEILGCE
jgi:hypothetical protein